MRPACAVRARPLARLQQGGAAMSSATVVGKLLRDQTDLPPSWGDPETGEPSRAARQELSWSLVHHTLAKLLYSEPLPCKVRVGRENVTVPVEEASWCALAEELGLSSEGDRRCLAGLLSRILRRGVPDAVPGDVPLSQLATGLLTLLDGFARHSRNGRRPAPHGGQLALESGLPQHETALRSVNALLEWAGHAGAMSDDRYRIAFHVVWRPLARRSRRELRPLPETPVLSLSLPLDFLRRARASHVGDSEQSTVPVPGEPIAADVSPALRRATTQRPSPWDPHARSLLQLLLEPLLTLRDDPTICVEAAAVAGDGFAVDILRAWRRALLSGDLVLFGEPGAVISLELPDRAWRIADGPFRPRNAAGAATIRVVRRGAMLGGEVLIPGTAVYESSR